MNNDLGLGVRVSPDTFIVLVDRQKPRHSLGSLKIQQ